MIDYLDKIIARTHGKQETIQPKTAALFGPMEAANEPTFEQNPILEKTAPDSQQAETRTEINNTRKISNQTPEDTTESETLVANCKSTSHLEPETRVWIESPETDQKIFEVAQPIRKAAKRADDKEIPSQPTKQIEAPPEPTASRIEPDSEEVPPRQAITPKIASAKAENLKQSTVKESIGSSQTTDYLQFSEEPPSPLPRQPSAIELPSESVADNLPPPLKKPVEKNSVQYARLSSENSPMKTIRPREIRPPPPMLMPLTNDESRTSVKQELYRPTSTREIGHLKAADQISQSRVSSPTKMLTSTSSPTVQVTVGRLEIQALVPPPTQPSGNNSPPVMSLNEYLKKRSEGSR